MTEREILKLIEKARESADNSFIPYTEIAVGASVLTKDNLLIGGCAIDTPNIILGAASVAILKAVSEGRLELKAVCVYCAGERLPYLNGIDREIASQFGKRMTVILSNDVSYERYHIDDFMPFNRQALEDN